MAHTDACKYQVVQFVGKCKDNGMSINQACKEAERETDGIPAQTVRSWWYEAQKETERVVENSTMGATPQSDSEIPANSSFSKESSCPSGEPPTATHGGKREGAGKTMTEKQRKANYNSVWMGVAQRMNSLAEHMSSKGQYPIKENAKPRTVGELNDALNLLNQILRRIRT